MVIDLIATIILSYLIYFFAITAHEMGHYIVMSIEDKKTKIERVGLLSFKTSGKVTDRTLGIAAINGVLLGWLVIYSTGAFLNPIAILIISVIYLFGCISDLKTIKEVWKYERF